MHPLIILLTMIAVTLGGYSLIWLAIEAFTFAANAQKDLPKLNDEGERAKKDRYLKVFARVLVLAAVLVGSFIASEIGAAEHRRLIAPQIQHPIQENDKGIKSRARSPVYLRVVHDETNVWDAISVTMLLTFIYGFCRLLRAIRRETERGAQLQQASQRTAAEQPTETS